MEHFFWIPNLDLLFSDKNSFELWAPIWPVDEEALGLPGSQTVEQLLARTQLFHQNHMGRGNEGIL